MFTSHVSVHACMCVCVHEGPHALLYSMRLKTKTRYKYHATDASPHSQPIFNILSPLIQTSKPCQLLTWRMISEILTAVNIKIAVVWDVMTCSLDLFCSEDGGKRYLRNGGTRLLVQGVTSQETVTLIQKSQD
jgi:hypothetical protein